MKLSSVLALCLGLSFAHGSLWADGVTRSLEPVVGGCKVTLAWEFSGKVDSDLIIEERLSPGWTVDSTTVPLVLLDATALSGSVARFALKPSLLANPGSFSFLVNSVDETVSGNVSGDWQIYRSGMLRKGNVSGGAVLSSLGVVRQRLMASLQMVKSANGVDAFASEVSTEQASDSAIVEIPVAISAFQVLDDSHVRLSYVGLRTSGTLCVEGCVGLGKKWEPITSCEVSAGDGDVVLTSEGAIAKYCFYRMKLLTTEDR